MKKILFLTLLYCTLAQSAQSKANGYIELLSQKQMVELLTELELARAWIYALENTNQQALVALFKTKAHHIYKSHNIDEVTFQVSYLHYLNHTELMIAIYDQVIDRLNELRNKA